MLASPHRVVAELLGQAHEPQAHGGIGRGEAVQPEQAEAHRPAQMAPVARAVSMSWSSMWRRSWRMSSVCCPRSGEVVMRDR